MTDRIRIIRHEVVPKCGSYEVRFSDGRPSKYFYYEDIPGRRLRSDQADSFQAQRMPRRWRGPKEIAPNHLCVIVRFRETVFFPFSVYSRELGGAIKRVPGIIVASHRNRNESSQPTRHRHLLRPMASLHRTTDRAKYSASSRFPFRPTRDQHRGDAWHRKDAEINDGDDKINLGAVAHGAHRST